MQIGIPYNIYQRGNAMTQLIIKIINKKGAKHETYAVASGIVGIICNILLCAAKFTIGSLSGSISITADALNNLSDTASNGVTIAGSKLAAKPVDKEHPFGHGRLEYISALAISGMILIMGFELAKSSIEKIIHPVEINFSIIYVITLLLSICVKLWMAYFNQRLYKLSNNLNLKTVKQDSLNDCMATGATIIALCVSHIFNIKRVDGAFGLIIAVIILFSGIEIAKDVVSTLLGKPPKKELVKALEDTITAPEIVLGVHDLIVHDYGPGRTMASAHAEVPQDADILKIHDVIDNVEQEILHKFNIIISIHTDPIAVNDKEVDKYKDLCEQVIKNYNSAYTFHDFRIVKGDTHTNLIFDLIVPFDKTDKQKINSDLIKLIKEKDPTLEPKITIEHSFV